MAATSVAIAPGYDQPRAGGRGNQPAGVLNRWHGEGRVAIKREIAAFGW
jgi:hypothetical protein